LLQAMKRFRSLTLMNALSALVALAAAIGFIKVWAVPGAVVGTAAGELVLAVLLWRIIRDERTTVVS
jgi:O-antigen/teichoic acid export membrane protein